MYITGSIDASDSDSIIFQGSKKSCELHQLPHGNHTMIKNTKKLDILNAKELVNRFPGLQLPSNTMAVFQPDGGYLKPEQVITF